MVFRFHSLPEAPGALQVFPPFPGHFPVSLGASLWQLRFHSWELCSKWKFLVGIIPGCEWSLQEEMRASLRGCGNRPACPDAEEGESSAPSQRGRGGGLSPPIPSSLEAPCHHLALEAQRTLPGSGPPSPSPPARVGMSGTKGEPEGVPTPEPPTAGIVYICSTKYPPIYTGFPQEIRFCR